MRAIVFSLLILSATSLAVSAHGQSAPARRAQLQQLAQQETDLEARIGAERNAMAHLLGALELFMRDPPPPLIVSAKDAREAVNAAILARAIAVQLERRQQALAAQSAQLSQLRRAADVASGDLLETDSALADREGRLTALSQDAALLTPPSARAAVNAQDAEPTPTEISAPVEGPVSARFGGRLANGERSQGLAFAPASGAVVKSPAAAVVAYAGPVNGWGQVVILRTGGGSHMVLSGLGRVTVTAGQSVAAEAPLGTMPAIGETAPELYLEVRMTSGPINPERMMGRGGAANVNASALRLRREGVN